jgi:8-oxo-dGTP pyrophosphatase MutT (NUDIX family)
MIAGKVTALILRVSPVGEELLLFEHPHAGIQIPAGTIEPDETPEAAVLREATEETGLTAYTTCEPLGHQDDVLPQHQRVTGRATTLYTRPDGQHTYGLTIRAGITVQIEREVAGLSQITYAEWDQSATPPYISYQLTGWALTADLAAIRRRHFFLLRYDQPTPERWQVETDHHQFTLFWAPLRALPAIWPPQDRWPAMLKHLR